MYSVGTGRREVAGCSWCLGDCRLCIPGISDPGRRFIPGPDLVTGVCEDEDRENRTEVCSGCCHCSYGWWFFSGCGDSIIHSILDA